MKSQWCLLLTALTVQPVFARTSWLVCEADKFDKSIAGYPVYDAIRIEQVDTLYGEKNANAITILLEKPNNRTIDRQINFSSALQQQAMLKVLKNPNRYFELWTNTNLGARLADAGLNLPADIFESWDVVAEDIQTHEIHTLKEWAEKLTK